MIKRNWKLAPLAALLLLAGCGGVDLVKPGVPADLGDGIAVTPTVAWAKIHEPGIPPIFTIDGIGLGEIRTFTGVAPGKPIIDISSLSNAEIGVYSAKMIPNDIMDLLAANLEKEGNQEVRTSNLAPAKFGSGKGFRFDLAFLTKDGLQMRGQALVAQRGGKLDVLLYQAPEEYYFAHRQPDVDQLLATLQASG